MKRNSYLRTNPILHVVFIVIVVVNIFPLFWMVSSAFKHPNELFTPDIRLIPHNPTLENFKVALFEYNFFRWLWNSVVTTLGISVGQMVVCLLAAFALCYYKTPFNAAVFYILIATIVVPFQVTMIPNYILISKMRLLNTTAAVIIPNLAVASTFFFLRQHIKTIPTDFYEVALMEGAKSPWILRNVAIPLCKGSISAMFILCVIDGWNMYFWPLLVLSKPETRTITIGLQQFLDFEVGNRWGPFMATASLASLPIIVLYLFIQRRIIEAFVSSGIKG
ncbi:carbohydrate ABC transporter permease [Breznakiella homolactica]|uniref:sn-glycerol-3-phosphate transport system permease protein UgpE n=1 Tax=Breznakiella homolactica TaxID=2798577 RepID=A0A7T8BBT0_9SPIR|nr:carbohydrate ABC transporter permease [Breznakiella homolactica]QQO10701.1 carbohydrate ABC transporter permease [Breznakiella homolactica]